MSVTVVRRQTLPSNFGFSFHSLENVPEIGSVQAFNAKFAFSVFLTTDINQIMATSEVPCFPITVHRPTQGAGTRMRGRR